MTLTFEGVLITHRSIYANPIVGVCLRRVVAIERIVAVVKIVVAASYIDILLTAPYTNLRRNALRSMGG